MKIKNLKQQSIFLLFLFFICVGCEDFLETAPSNDVSQDNVFDTTDHIQTLLDGTYRIMKQELNQKTMDIRLDVVDGRDVMMNSSGFFNGDYELALDKTVENLGEVASLWSFYYNLINHANNIVTHVDDAKGSEEEKSRIKGEALSIRAFAYFYLINHFQHAWIKGSELPGVPIYTIPASGETFGNPRGNVNDVYNQIISDLKTAISLVPQDRIHKGYINVNVAKGLLARTYLFQGEFELASKFASEARVGYPLCSQADYVAGFNNISNSEWIWGLPIGTEEMVMDSYFSDYDLERPNSAWSIRMNNRFYNMFSDTDCRAKLSVEGKSPLIIYKNESPINLPIENIQDSLVTRKFRDNSSFTGHFVMMRSSEMILIEAEAEAELESYSVAQNLLFEVQQRADNLAIKSTAIGQELIDEILLERRKELYGEGLASVFDLKRRNLPLVREGNQVHGGFEAGSNRLVWQLPTSEIENNTSISQSEQNPL